MDVLQPALHKAAAALSAHLALGYFVPFCLTSVAILARVRVRTNPSPPRRLHCLRELQVRLANSTQ